ncbi:cytidine deaminase [Pseudoalteromonas ardens]|uniref:Cytidine deaminase n=1 Tax=Pseudoalteromonas rubra TaxID=43658 RepID=A0A0L0EMB6_9GAMM|nr:cytidine deaminase [Pseudoalteromonas sp. R96]KNC65597.1 cytidine deaminase [Pseudoalteromonas rubra]MDK1309896.1 cytidine deaminase [Pseudoalteromonas sp. R96]
MADTDNKLIPSVLEACKTANGVLNSELQTHIQALLGCSKTQLGQALLPYAASFAQAPISSFLVGAVAYDKHSDHYFLGANLEFSHRALSLVVHAEQAAINNAWLNGAKEITSLDITAAPCGYCRQFMNELSNAKELKITLPTGETTLSQLLPGDFGPTDLGNQESLFDSAPIAINKVGELSDKLVSHLSQVYAPYTKNIAAAELVMKSGKRFYGRYVENAAYSPSLSPMQSALSQLAMSGEILAEAKLERATLVETKGRENQRAVTEAVISSFNETLKLHYYLIESKQA